MFTVSTGVYRNRIGENRTEQRPGKKTLRQKKPGQCPKPEPLMDSYPGCLSPPQQKAAPTQGSKTTKTRRDLRGYPSKSPASHPHNNQSSSKELSTAPQRSTAPPAKVGPPAPPPAARLMSGLGCPPAPKRRGFNHHGEEGDVLGCACIGCLQMPALVNDLEPSGIERKQLCSHPEGAPERVAVPSFQK